MPSKRTSDSVDRIIQDLGRKQNAEDIRNSMNERQIDEILSSAGINVEEPGSLADVNVPELEVGGGSAPSDKYSTAMLDEILKDLPSMKQAAAYADAAPKPRPEPGRKNGTVSHTMQYRRQATDPPLRARQATPAPVAEPPHAPRLRQTTSTQQFRQAAPTQQVNQVTPAQPVRQAAPAQQPRQVPPAQQPRRAQPQAAPQPVHRPEQTSLRQPAEQPPRQTGGDVGDTTRTGIIKGFLMKMAPEGAGSDAEALDEGKQQFVKYFGNSAAVVPDSKGRLRDPARPKKRGLFGLTKASDTGEFVPINVSLSGRDEQSQAGRNAYDARDEQTYDQTDDTYTEETEVQEEYYPDAPEQEEPQREWEDADHYEPQSRHADDGKKGGFFAGLFGGKKSRPREELPIPEPREELAENTSELALGDYEDAPAEEQKYPPLEATSELSRTMIHSKYSGTKNVEPDERELYSTMGGDTLSFIHEAIRNKETAATAQPRVEPTADALPHDELPTYEPTAKIQPTYEATTYEPPVSEPTAGELTTYEPTASELTTYEPTAYELSADEPTAYELPGDEPEDATQQPAGKKYRKGGSTVVFEPGEKKNSKFPDFMMDGHSEPVGEPVMTPLLQVRPGEPVAAVAPVRTADDTAGFSMRIGEDDGTENTQDFLQSISDGAGTRPQQTETTTEYAPQGDAEPLPADSGYEKDGTRYVPEYEEAPEQYETEPEPAEATTFGEIPAEVTQTLTGQMRLADIAARTETLRADKETRGEAMNAPLTSEFPDMPGTEEAEFTGDFQPEEDLAQPQASLTREEIEKQAFVSDIAGSINFDNDPMEGTAQLNPLRSDGPDDLTDEDGRYAGPEQDEAKDVAGLEDTHTELRGLGGLFGFGAKLRSGGKPENERPGIRVPFGHNVASRKDYDTLDDANTVRVELEQQVFMLGISAIVSGVLGAVMLYFGTAAAGSVLPLPAPLDPSAGKIPLLVVLLVMLIATGALCWRTLLEGAQGVLRSPSPDSMPTLAFVGALVQLIVFIIVPDVYDPTRYCLLAGPAALLLCLNCIGKLLAAGTAAENFKLVSSGMNHAVAYRLRDAGVLHAITGGLSEPRPCVLVSRPTQLLKRFVASSTSHGTSDKNQQQFARIVGVCGLVSFLFTLIYRKDAGMAVTALAATLCIGAPLAGTLLSALPARLMQRSAAQIGAVIPGWKDIRQLGRINVIETTAHDLFPSGCVNFSGIKPVNEDNIYQAIIYAASMLADAGDNMRDVFVGMIGDASKQLCKVDDLKNIPGRGCIGWIDGERVLIGNRSLMEDYSIKLPSAAYEQRHTVNQRRVIYLAVSGKLYAMFQVTYESDPDTAVVLDTLRHNGMSLIVDCDDFNCDASLLETAYNLPVGSVKVLTTEEREAIEPATAWLPESEGNMLHLGSFSSFVGGLEAAAGAAEGERKSALVVSASVLLSCLLAVIMALGGGLAALPLPALVLYQAAWAVLALIFPLLQRY